MQRKTSENNTTGKLQRQLQSQMQKKSREYTRVVHKGVSRDTKHLPHMDPQLFLSYLEVRCGTGEVVLCG